MKQEQETVENIAQIAEKIAVTRGVQERKEIALNELESIKSKELYWKEKYDKCISVIRKFDAGIIGMYDL